jgi:probable HAF family extracellular repeat protein
MRAVRAEAYTGIFGCSKFKSRGEKNMKFRIITLMFALCALAALTTSVQSSAQQLIEFDAPGAATASSPACYPDCGTVPNGINDLGVIVGFYTDANIVPHGFLRTPGGKITSFDAPGAVWGMASTRAPSLTTSTTWA